MIEVALKDIHEYRKGDEMGNQKLFIHLSEPQIP